METTNFTFEKDEKGRDAFPVISVQDFCGA